MQGVQCLWPELWGDRKQKAGAGHRQVTAYIFQFWNACFLLSADFVFYISAMETERCQKGMTVAYAAHCQQEAALDRSLIC